MFHLVPASPQESLPQNRTHTTELFSVVCHTGQSVKLCFGYKITSERWWSVLYTKKLSNPLNENSIKKKRLATIHCNPTAKRTLQYFIVNMKSMEEEKKSRLSIPAFTQEKCQNFCNCLFEVNWKFRGLYAPEVASVQMHWKIAIWKNIGNNSHGDGLFCKLKGQWCLFKWFTLSEYKWCLRQNLKFTTWKVYKLYIPPIYKCQLIFAIVFELIARMFL